MFFGQTFVVFIEEVIAKARRVQHQLACGDIGFRRTQTRLAIVVKAVDHLQIADRGRVFLGRCIKVQQPVLYALQRGRARNRLGRGKDRKDGVFGHRIAADAPFAGCTGVDVAVAVGDHRHNARNTGRAAGQAVQHTVATRFDIGCNRIFHVVPP